MFDAEDLRFRGTGRPQIGDWIMMVLPEPPVIDSPYRAFPVEVVKIDSKRKRVHVVGDANLLWLGMSGGTPDVADAGLADVLKTRVLTFEQCERMGDEYVPSAQVGLIEDGGHAEI